jgi:hypothetical protein
MKLNCRFNFLILNYSRLLILDLFDITFKLWILCFIFIFRKSTLFLPKISIMNNKFWFQISFSLFEFFINFNFLQIIILTLIILFKCLLLLIHNSIGRSWIATYRRRSLGIHIFCIIVAITFGIAFAVYWGRLWRNTISS